MCGVRYGRPPFGVAALFLRQRCDRGEGRAVRSGSVFGRCDAWPASDSRVGFPRPIPVCVPACISAFIPVRVSGCIGLCSGLRLGPHFGLHWPAFWFASRSAFRFAFRFACEAALRGLLWKKASRRGVGWGFFGGVPSPKKDRLPEGKRSCALKRRNRRVVPRVLSRRLCYRSLLTSCCTRGRVASGLEAGRAEPVSSLTGDAPSRLTVRLLRKTGPKFPAASFATARK